MSHPALELFFGPAFSDDDGSSRRWSSGPRRVDAGELDGDTAHADHRHLDRIRSSDKQVFAELYDAYFTQLSALAFRYVREVAAAEDVVHDVFLKLWHIRTTIEIHTTLRAYLFTMVVNRARDVSAQTRRDDAILSPMRAEEVPVSTDSHAIEASPQDRLESADVRQMVTTAVAALPERQRLALTLRLSNDMTYDEIAVVLGITKSSVAELIGKAQRHLRLTLGPRLL